MQTKRTNNGDHPNSRRNLVLTPEQRQENLIKITARARERSEKENQRIWGLIVEAGMENKTAREAEAVLGIRTHKILRVKRWHRAKTVVEES